MHIACANLFTAFLRKLSVIWAIILVNNELEGMWKEAAMVSSR